VKNKPIILMGFKHVGKSVIGKALAVKLKRVFIDLDRHMEYLFREKFQKKRSCRQIMKVHGEAFFRTLETRTLKQVIRTDKAVIALGGGTPLESNNQEILKPYILIHITAPSDKVLRRITKNGKPAFIAEKDNTREALSVLWQKREKIYQKLADFSIENNSNIPFAVEQIVMKLKQ
jgi:shikimate kinase